MGYFGYIKRQKKRGKKMIQNKKELYKLIEDFEEKNEIKNIILLGKNEKINNIILEDI